MRLSNWAIISSIIGVLATSCSPKQANESSESTTPVVEDATSPEEPKSTLAVAYINSDTIMSKYEFATKLRDELTAQQLKYENVLRQKESQLRIDLQKLQAEAATLSQFEGKNRERKLYQEQEKLQTMQDEYSRNLMVLEQDFNREIDRAIHDFLEEYCADKPFEMVLSNSDLGLIRWADKRLDITDDVLNGLNKAYYEKQAESIPESK